MAHVNKLSDTLDSRDVEARIEELKEMDVPTFSVRRHTKGESTDINEEVEGYWESVDKLYDLIEEVGGPDNVLQELLTLMKETAKKEPTEYPSRSHEVDNMVFSLTKIKDSNLDEDEKQELADLEKFAQQGRGYGDWASGANLISLNHFSDYVQNTIEIPGLPSFVCVDWDQTAENLKSDYTHLNFDGETFLIQS